MLDQTRFSSWQGENLFARGWLPVFMEGFFFLCSKMCSWIQWTGVAAEYSNWQLTAINHHCQTRNWVNWLGGAHSNSSLFIFNQVCTTTLKGIKWSHLFLWLFFFPHNATVYKIYTMWPKVNGQHGTKCMDTPIMEHLIPKPWAFICLYNNPHSSAKAIH